MREKKGEVLLRKLLKRWSNHKIMTSWLSRFFHYLDRYYIPRWELPSLKETSFLSFYDLVGDDIHSFEKLHTAIFSCYFDFRLYPFLTLSFTSFNYVSQVYDEMNKQIMDAIFAMVLSNTLSKHVLLFNYKKRFHHDWNSLMRFNDAWCFYDFVTHIVEWQIIQLCSFYCSTDIHCNVAACLSRLIGNVQESRLIEHWLTTRWLSTRRLEIAQKKTLPENSLQKEWLKRMRHSIMMRLQIGYQLLPSWIPYQRWFQLIFFLYLLSLQLLY